MLLFSQRYKLAQQVERRFERAERLLNKPSDPTAVTITRGPLNVIGELQAMGWLRDKPIRAKWQSIDLRKLMVSARQGSAYRTERARLKRVKKRKP